MTKADLVEKVTRLGDLTRRDGEIIVETIFDSVITALQGGDKIEIRGFGSFTTSCYATVCPVQIPWDNNKSLELSLPGEWCALQDLNLRPPVCDTDALPLS